MIHSPLAYCLLQNHENKRKTAVNLPCPDDEPDAGVKGLNGPGFGRLHRFHAKRDLGPNSNIYNIHANSSLVIYFLFGSVA